MWVCAVLRERRAQSLKHPLLLVDLAVKSVVNGDQGLALHLGVVMPQVGAPPASVTVQSAGPAAQAFGAAPIGDLTWAPMGQRVILPARDFDVACAAADSVTLAVLA
jgi:hypothetical protein